jgi:hypothetical protein
MSKEMQKIRQMWFSDEPEDKDIAYKWLVSLIGEKDARVNLFILSFYKNWDDDGGYEDADGNFWQLIFKTYPTYYGKDYRYTVTKISFFDGVKLIKGDRDYSRWDVGNGQPKWDLCQLLCDKFRELGHTFHDELFHESNKISK